jgi:ABC-2 type transport system permease protein
MTGAIRYFRLWLSFARFGLTRELAFRGNFLVKITVEALWLGILLIFYDTVFAQTSVVASWTWEEYLFFLGCHYALGGLIETLFLGNCGEFAELVRSGDLDFYLLRPVDEQFLVTIRDVDWSTAPNVLLGAAIMCFALWQVGWSFDLGQVLVFLVMFACGVGLAYSFLLLLTSSSVWMVRNQSLYEVWWLFTTLMRYPREIFAGAWAYPLGWFFSFVVPVILVTNVPARAMVKVLDWPVALYTVLATAALLWLSRRVFRLALRRYRSASS